MKRSTLTALLVSTIIGGSLLTYSVVSHAEDKAPAKPAVAAAKSDSKVAGDYVVVKYKGGEIRKSELEKQWNTLFPDGDAPDIESFDENVRVEILKNMARERLVLDKAYAKKIESTNEFKEQLEIVKRQLLINSYLKSVMGEIVPEKDVRKEYDVIVEKFKGKSEVKARHILVESEAEAKTLHEEIKKGGDFEKIAKEKSIDTGSGSQGGDLGYFTKDRMVPEFADAAFKAKKGEVTAPVKSDFGWHIILVEDVRPLKAPAFEEVREKIEQSLANNGIESYVNRLFKQNEVKYFAADGKELKEAPEAAPTTGATKPAAKTAAKPAAKADDAVAQAKAAALIEAKKKEEAEAAKKKSAE